MSTSYNAILGVGKEFWEDYEVFDFLLEQKFVAEDDREEYEEDGGCEWFYDRSKKYGSLELTMQDCYNGNGFFLGFTLNPRDVDAFGLQVSEAKMKWTNLFTENPEMCHFVQIC
jgi:hypothetical protein